MNINVLRFTNFLIDNIIFTIFSFVFLHYFADKINRESAAAILFFCYFLYYFLQELAWKKTIGKYITNTIVVSKVPNEKYFIWQILIRTLLRFIIIDTLSYLFTKKGLHDFLSKTETIKLKDNITKVEFRNH